MKSEKNIIEDIEKMKKVLSYVETRMVTGKEKSSNSYTILTLRAKIEYASSVLSDTPYLQREGL